MSETLLPADDLARPLKVARPDTDESLLHIGLVGNTYTVLLSGADTEGRYCLIDMPYTSECSVLKRIGDCTIAYQRLALPLVSDRDYTLRSEHSKAPGPNGPIYRIQWEPANDLGPSVKPGVQRVNLCEGGWLIEPDGAGTTRATYTIYTDSGGAIPAVIANRGSRTAIRKMFAAIRKAVHEPKYAGSKS